MTTRAIIPFTSDLFSKPPLGKSEFLEMEDWLISIGAKTKSNARSISLPENDPRVGEIMDRLKCYGLTAYNGYPPPELRNTHYRFCIHRTWDEADLDAAPLLLLRDWSGTERGSLSVPVDDLVNFHRLRVEWMNRPVEGGTLGWDEPFGRLGGYVHFGVHPSVKNLLEQDLAGGSFPLAEWDDPTNVKGDYHFLESSILMPPCLTPIVTVYDSVFYQEGCYWPAELAFSRETVEAMGPFDIAWTQETIGAAVSKRLGDRHRSLIVSQKFRRLAKSLMTRPTQVLELYPVKLV